MARIALAVLVLLTAACTADRATLNEVGTTLVVLPDGAQVKAEIMTKPGDMMRGMMFRDSLPADRGMLFIHGSAGRYSYWMYQVRIPLDIIWMDRQRRVVEISADTPPCDKVPSSRDCPNYGGHAEAIYVLELAGGQAAKHNIVVGSILKF